LANYTKSCANFYSKHLRIFTQWARKADSKTSSLQKIQHGYDQCRYYSEEKQRCRKNRSHYDIHNTVRYLQPVIGLLGSKRRACKFCDIRGIRDDRRYIRGPALEFIAELAVIGLCRSSGYLNRVTVTVLCLTYNNTVRYKDYRVVNDFGINADCDG